MATVELCTNSESCCIEFTGIKLGNLRHEKPPLQEMPLLGAAASGLQIQCPSIIDGLHVQKLDRGLSAAADVKFFVNLFQVPAHCFHRYA